VTDRGPIRTSATWRLGVLSGLLAATTVLPALVPLSSQVEEAQVAGDKARAVTAIRALASLPTAQERVQLAQALGLREASLGRDPVQWSLHHGYAFPHACDAPPADTLWIPTEGQWLACGALDGQTFAVAVDRTPGRRWFAPTFVLGLALAVGLSTTLGVLQTLTPLSAIARAVRAVGEGRRAEPIPATGLAELDLLGERVMAAAHAVEDRIDTVEARIAVVQHLARVVAHEIRNPLQSMTIIAEEQVDEGDRQVRKARTDDLLAEIRTLDDVVRRLLRDAPGQAALAPTLQETDVPALLASVIAFLRRGVRDDSVVLRLGPVPTATLQADRSLLRRALENLVLNALQAPRAAQPHEVTLSAHLDASGALTIRVADNGAGIPESVRDHVFEAGVSGRPGGSGLGLSLSRGVFLAHGGDLHHESRPEGGTVFVGTLPCRQGARSTPSPT
jgi:signal transduction histidine kinase